MRDTEEFYRFYRDRMIYPEARPNAAHLKLAELERAGNLTAVITQNIDGLHSAAGSQNVIELHGSVHRNHCMKCGKPLRSGIHSERPRSAALQLRRNSQARRGAL